MTSRTAIERTLYELLRLALVQRGHLPDILQYAGDKPGYEAACKALDQQGRLIEVFGIASPQQRGEVGKNRFVWQAKGEGLGSYTGWPEVTFDTLESGLFQKLQAPDQATTLNYELRYISSSVGTSRLMQTILDQTLGRRRALQLLDDDGNLTATYLWLLWQGADDVPGLTFIERLQRYQVPDAWLTDFTPLGPPIPALTTAQPNIAPGN